MKLPQLSLRDLFWLVLVAAMVVGWGWSVRERNSNVSERNFSTRNEKQLRRYLEAIEAANASKERYDQMIQSIIRPFVSPLPDDET